MADALPPLPAQPAGTPWPTREWPTGPGPASVPARALRRLDAAFGPDPAEELGATHAVVIVKSGRLLAERYADGFGPDVPCRSWSMAKSITQALVGLAAGDGRFDIHAPAAVPAWRGAGDPRAAITLDHLLRMSSGLAWVEDYSPENPSDVIEMLFGKGAGDVAAFAEGAPLAHTPGTHFYYSSGTTNIVSACLGRALSATGSAMAAFMRGASALTPSCASMLTHRAATSTVGGSSRAPWSANGMLFR